jgi:hypothetical protein
VAGCGSTVSTGVADAQIAVHVKTALLNDPTLGTQPIEVGVVGGVVYLQGRVGSAEDLDRAVALARAVPGVVDVRSVLTVGPTSTSTTGRNPGLQALPEPQPPPRLIALGVSTSLVSPTSADLGRDLNIGPFVKLSPRRGLRVSVGFSWFDTEMIEGPTGAAALATLRMRPVMAGVEYGLTERRLGVALSVVGGYAFNRLNVDTGAAGSERAIAVDNSLVWRPGLSAWIHLAPRWGLNLSAGVLMSRPAVTFASDTAVTVARVRVIAPIVSVGVGYWVF